jgi:hypothetical protein
VDLGGAAEVRFVGVSDRRVRKLQRTGLGEGGQSMVGIGFAGGYLAWGLNCLVSRGERLLAGVYRYRLSTGELARATPPPRPPLARDPALLPLRGQAIRPPRALTAASRAQGASAPALRAARLCTATKAHRRSPRPARDSATCYEDSAKRRVAMRHLSGGLLTAPFRRLRSGGHERKRGTAGQRAHALPMQEPGQERLGRADAPRPEQARAPGR